MQFNARSPRELNEALLAKGFRCPNQHIAVLREEPETVTKSGLIIPDTATRLVRRGVIVLVGERVDNGVQAGDGCVLQVYEATLVELELGGTKATVEIIHQNDVLLTWPNGKVRGA